MPYQCRDCTHKGSVFPSGLCPACGSSNATSLNTISREIKARPSYRLALGASLWIYLVVSIGQKLGYW